MLEFRTAGFNPYAVQYSPYVDSRLAVATGANFGIVGNGRLYILNLSPEGVIAPLRQFDTNDAQYDLAWSEVNESQVLVACGDGAVRLFDVSSPPAAGPFPVGIFHEHKRETFSVAWAPVSKDTFLSSSWDGTVKVWSPARPGGPALRTLPVGGCVYSAQYNPGNPHIISAVAADSMLRVWDLRTPVTSAYHLTSKMLIHGGSAPVATSPGAPGPELGSMMQAPSEVLTHDWNKYRDTVIATGSVDRLVRTFDLRFPGRGPVGVMAGHAFAVRRLAWSPHAADVLISASYDMTVRLWTDGSTLAVPPSGGPGGGMGEEGVGPTRAGVQLGIMNRHTEFVTGVDWCLFGAGGWVSTVGWDERVLIWDAKMLLQPGG